MRASADINPELLVWARETAGLNPPDAAKKLNTSVERYAGWERGETQPTMNQLRKAANAFKRPINVFFLPTVPKQASVPPVDFRTVQTSDPVSSRSLIFLRRVHEYREQYLELSTRLGRSVPAFTIKWNRKHRIEDISRKIRSFTRVSLSLQRSWRTDYEAFNGWKTALEQQGVLIFQLSVPVSELRGASFFFEVAPIIVLSSSDAPNGRIFSLLHELCHLGMRQSGICDQKHRSTEVDEVFCNRVAGETLVPTVNLLADIGGQKGNWGEHQIGTLARQYSVSRYVIARRLYSMDRMSEGTYNTLTRQWNAEHTANKENNKGFVPPSRKAVSEKGKPFVRSVLRSYYEDTITLSDVSQMLGVKVKHIPKIEEDVL